MRAGNWNHTFTGTKFYALDPAPEEVVLEDIIVSLPKLCRFGGHIPNFYSVAQHSMLMASQFEKGSVEYLWCLAHDFGEAYICDIPRPFKGSLMAEYYDPLDGEYVEETIREVEARILDSIKIRFGLPDIPDVVWEMDNRILLTEAMQFYSDGRYKEWGLWGAVEPLNIVITPMCVEEISEKFRVVVEDAFC